MTLLRKCWHTAAVAATERLGDGWYFVLDYVLRFLRVAVLLAIWRTILAGRGDHGENGMTLDQVLTYTLANAVFADQVAARTNLEIQLWNGSIGSMLVRPMDLVAQVVARMAGGWLLGLGCFSLPLLLAAPLLGVSPLPAGPGAAALFVVSLALAVSVAVALDFGISSLMARYGWNVWDVERVRSASFTLLSGAVVPLALLPWGLGDVLAWLPFGAMAWAPLRIYTGTGSAWEAGQLVAAQAGWAVALALVAQWLWRVNRQKVVIYGG